MSLRKYRQCPHCKSKKGFKLTIQLGGHQEEIRDFNGKVIDCDRQGTDDIEYAECIECEKSIDIEKLEFD